MCLPGAGHGVSPRNTGWFTALPAKPSISYRPDTTIKRGYCALRGRAGRLLPDKSSSHRDARTSHLAETPITHICWPERDRFPDAVPYTYALQLHFIRHADPVRRAFLFHASPLP